MTFYSCGEKVHLSRACRLQRKGNSQKRYQKGRKENSAAVEVSSQESLVNNFIVALQTLSTCGDEKVDKFSNTITLSEIKGKFYRTLLDSGPTKCFVDFDLQICLASWRAPWPCSPSPYYPRLTGHDILGNKSSRKWGWVGVSRGYIKPASV